MQESCDEGEWESYKETRAGQTKEDDLWNGMEKDGAGQ